MRSRERIRPELAQRLMAVQALPDLASDKATIDVTGTQRRLRALLAAGWQLTWLARRLDASVNNIRHLLYRRGEVTVATARSVKTLYTELAMQIPPAPAVYKPARRLRWPKPIELDDALIDDPSSNPSYMLSPHEEAVVDEAAVLQRMRGDRTAKVGKAGAAKVIARLRAEGLSDAEISRRTGLKVDRYAPRRRDLPATNRPSARAAS